MWWLYCACVVCCTGFSHSHSHRLFFTNFTWFQHERPILCHVYQFLRRLLPWDAMPNGGWTHETSACYEQFEVLLTIHHSRVDFGCFFCVFGLVCWLLPCRFFFLARFPPVGLTSIFLWHLYSIHALMKHRCVARLLCAIVHCTCTIHSNNNNNNNNHDNQPVNCEANCRMETIGHFSI